jgi:hypothetical protein
MSISDFSDMFPHTIVVTAFGGTYGDYGKPTDGAITLYSGRVFFKPHMVVDQNGATIVASGEIWLQTTTRINIKDKIEYDEDTTVSPSVLTRLFPLRIDHAPDESGSHHVKIHFK